MKKTSKANLISRAAMICALYVALTLLASAVGLANGAVQIRLSEALCVLPVFLPEAIGALTLGCFLSNIITGCVVPDVIFGTLATFIGALFTRIFRKKRPVAIMCPVVSNTIIVPFVLKYAYSLGNAWYYLAFTVFVGEMISCVLLGSMLIKATEKYLGYIK